MTAVSDLKQDAVQHALESKARRIARVAGYVARKSRWRRHSIDNFGEFMIVDPAGNYPVAGFRYDMSAEEVIDWFKSEE